MSRNFGISQRFVAATVIAFVLVAGAMLLVTNHYMTATLDNAEENELYALVATLQANLDKEGEMAQGMSALVAGIPRVQELLAARDREALKALFVPGFAALKQNYGIRQFQFHLPPATSFLRVHNPEKFGDDLSSFRPAVVETNRSGKPNRGLEVGVAGLGIRGVVPVAYEGRPVGSVEFGYSFGQPFIDWFSNKFDVDVALYLQRDGGLQLLASSFGERPLLTQEQLGEAMRQGEYFGKGELDGTPVITFAHVINDFSGKPIGVVEIAKDRSGYLAQAKASNNLIPGLAGGTDHRITAGDHAKALNNLMLGLGVAGSLLIGLFAWLISRGVVRPIQRTALAMEQIANEGGTLGARLDESGNDEVTRLSKAFNQFVAKIEQLVSRVSGSAGDLGVVVAEFSALSSHTNSGVRRQQEQTAQVATAMTEMSATVHDVAENATRTAEAAADADGQANTGKEVVGNAMKSISQLAGEVERAVEMVRRVEEDSARIGSVLDVIRGIAEQTNLLALNAAIEAARAGEQGRGFAVVADEVRSLAQRTQQSTQEIQQMIESLQGGVSDTVEVMAVGQQQASLSVEQAARARESLDAITAAVDTITEMSAQIATASEEQSAVAEDINRSMVEIAEVADQTSQDSARSFEASQQLAGHVDELVELVGHFHTGDSRQELIRARATHMAWKAKLRGFLDGNTTLDERAALSHTDCSLGKWYESVGKREFSHIPQLARLEAPHRELHEVIRRVVELKSKGDQEAAEQEYLKVGPLSEQIVQLIREIEQQV